MKKILLFLLVIVSFQAFGQDSYYGESKIGRFVFYGFFDNPTNYQYRVVRERSIAAMFDSSLHIPRYNGVPVGLRAGSSIQDGLIAMDTTNNIFYIYSGGVWRGQTGTNIFNSNGILEGNRTLTGLNNTYSLNFDSLNSWRVQRNGITRFSMSSTTSSMIGPNTNAAFTANNTQAIVNYQGNALRVAVDSSTITKKIVYETNINGSLTIPNSLITRSLLDSLLAAAGGGYFNPNQTSTGNTVHDGNVKTFDVLNLASHQLRAGVLNYSSSSLDSTTNQIVSVVNTSDESYTVLTDAPNRRILIRAYDTSPLLESDIEIKPDSIYFYQENGIYHFDNVATDNTATYVYAKNALNQMVKRTVASLGGSGTLSRIGTLDSLVKVANGMQISGVSIIPQSADSTYAGLLKNIDYNRSYKLKQNYNPTGTVTINIDSAAQVIWYLTSTGGRTLAFSNLRRGDIAILSFDNTSGSNITLTLPSNSYVNLVSAATAVIPADKSSLGLALYDGTNYWFTQSLTGGGTSFVQDGNSFGASAVLGTNDNNTLSFEINNTQRLKIGTSPTRRLQLGDLSLSATSTPEQFSMGGTYNDALGVSPKLKILDDGTNISGIGFGLSGTAEQSYYLSSATWHHTFYGGAVKILDMIPNLKKVIIGDGTTTVNDPYNLAFGTDISFSPLIGLKISLYDNGASSSGFGISNGTGTTQVNYVAASTIYHSFYNNGAKTFNLTSSQGNFTGKVYIGDSATTPTARLHINAGATAASSAPLKFTLGPFQTTAEAGAMEYDSLKLTMTNATAIRQEVPLIQQSRVTTQFDKTNQTLENITGLTGTLAAGRSYRFEATLYTSSDVTGGIKVAIAGTSTATSIIYEAQVFNGGVTVATGQQRTTTQGNAVGDVTAVTAAYVKITGTITVNAAGTLTVQSARNAATGTTSVLTGSTFVITQML